MKDLPFGLGPITDYLLRGNDISAVDALLSSRVFPSSVHGLAEYEGVVTGLLFFIRVWEYKWSGP